ncbi:MAG: IS110 family transposase [Ignavibacteriales bacterium]|nr:IS110 family transposase [Ignavibacteriales bacterium]
MKNLYLGGDVSKGYCDFIIINEEKAIVEEGFQLDDNQSGHKKLRKVLLATIKQHSPEAVYAAVESTGGYENNWYSLLKKLSTDMPVLVARINPIGTNHSSKAKMERIVTDATSARNIAEYIINYKQRIEFGKEDPFFTIRKQWGFYQMLLKQRTQLYNQLQGDLYIVHPELLRHIKFGYPNWLLQVIKQYPTSAHLSKARIPTLMKIKHIDQKRASTLVERAKASVSSSADAVMGNLVVSVVEQIHQMTATIKRQGEYICSQCDQPEIELLTSFTGIGKISAIGLLMEIGSICRFSDAKHLASYFGLHPVFKISGDGRKGMHMSKQGRKQPRAILYNVTRTAIVHNALIKTIYQKHLAKGMRKMAAIGACMHKILRIVFGILNGKKPFDPNIDIKKQQ